MKFTICVILLIYALRQVNGEAHTGQLIKPQIVLSGNNAPKQPHHHPSPFPIPPKGLCMCFPGRPGPKGAAGINGENGAKGKSGLKGRKGIMGDHGTRGKNGDRGDKGLRGYPGEKGPSGEVGSPGIKGEQGDRGQPGNKGHQGDKGVKGQIGNSNTEKGLPGDKGEKGDKGPPGIIYPGYLEFIIALEALSNIPILNINAEK